MTKPPTHQATARQIERILRQAGGLSTLPEIAAELLTLLAEAVCDAERLAAIIQTDSALSANVLSLAARQGVAFTDNRPTIQEAVALLSRDVLREAILSAKVFPMLNWAADADSQSLLPRRQLALHSLATACCAEQLAQFVLPPEQRQAAYLAGLLHDIGKSALGEIMPKSFERLVQQARATGAELAVIEQEHLGLDHASLGKRLAEKWQLPDAIVACIWLHHTDAQTMAAARAEPILPAVVALADRLARKAAIGQSGSYGEPDDAQEWIDFLKLTPDQVQQTQDDLTLAVSRHCEQIQWTCDKTPAAYVAAVQDAATGLARDNRLLSARSKRCAALTDQNALIQGILDDISEYSTPIEIAEQFAAFWQKHYTCGATAAVVIGDAADIPDAQADMAIVARNGKTRVVSVPTPTDRPVVPEALTKGFCVVPVCEAAQWLPAAMDTELNPEQMRMAPLAMQDKVVGVLLFEATADETGEQADRALACQIAAFAMTMALNVQKHAHLSDQFVQMLGALRRARTDLARTQSMQGLAEMAAGAAHELNNPLAVISGRAQLLVDAEEDDTKKQMLRQIQQRTEEISQIVSDLMSFARPSAPQKRQATLDELIAKAVEKTCDRCALESLEINCDIDGSRTVYVDVHQTTEALAQIFANATQSYPGQNGPIWTTSDDGDDRALVLRIRDEGCGMDDQTLQKATEPFFSHRPAGRRRGMGLAHARRLLGLNDGSLRLESAPQKGTTVIVRLPKV